MSDKNSSLINLPDLPDSIDNAVKNLTDKPTQGVGQTLADVWYLVFGGITQAADKRRISQFILRLRKPITIRLFLQKLFALTLQKEQLFINILVFSLLLGRIFLKSA